MTGEQSRLAPALRSSGRPSDSLDLRRLKALRRVAVQDNFVSYTVKAEEEANMDRIAAHKSRTAISSPLEPLIVTLLKSFTDDSDLASKLKALFKAIPCGGASG